MRSSHLFLIAVLTLGIVCKEIEACLPLIIPAIIAAVAPIATFAAGKDVGGKKDVDRPKNRMIGCFADTMYARDLEVTAIENNKEMSLALCTDNCKKAGKKYMGLQNGVDCYCGDKYGKFSEISNIRCDKTCAGSNDKETCGGYLANSVYEV